jgi:hypothetical protein
VLAHIPTCARSTGAGEHVTRTETNCGTVRINRVGSCSSVLKTTFFMVGSSVRHFSVSSRMREFFLGRSELAFL